MNPKTKTYILILLLTLLIATLTGCQRAAKAPPKPPYDNPLPPGQTALRKITNPAMLPDFTMARTNDPALRQAISNSLNYLSKPSSKTFYPCGQITHQMAVNSLNEFAAMLDSGISGPALNAAIREKFDVYMSVGCDNRGTVLFTGYYTPIFNGSPTRSPRFKFPLYKSPPNLVKNSKGDILGRRMADDKVIPFPPRAVLEDAYVLSGNELVWLEDEFEAYITHVQGSAKIRFPDSSIQTYGYSANNGHEYKSISQRMIQDGAISKSQLTLSAMIDYFKQNVDQIKRYTRLNPRYVFFRKEKQNPMGSLNEPVIPMRTIATDKAVFPRGCLTFINTTLPAAMGQRTVIRPYSGFALDQDTGGAIRAPGRCDVYIGVGDTAGKLAGATYQEGKLYYLFLK